MNSAHPDPSSALPMWFPFEGDLHAFLQDAFDSDTQSAQLSTAFRAYYAFRALLPVSIRWKLQQIRNSGATLEEFCPNELISKFEKHLQDLPALWPDCAEVAFVLTHDVETSYGASLIDKLARLEEEIGFRSSWNIVPYKYETDRALLDDLRQRGHEIGIHGYNHDGRLFMNKRIFDSRVPAINRAGAEHGAVGFRAPMVHRKLDWMQSLNFDYDSSCFDADPRQAMPGGVMSLWPFIVGKLVELPYTMPQDHTLFVTLAQTTDEFWRRKLEIIRRVRGMALMLTHPDYLDSDSRLSAYGDFLRYVRDEISTWHVLPKDLASWVRNLRSRESTVATTA